MNRWIRDLDRILRGEATRVSALQEERIEIPAGGLSVVIVVLGAAYGLCMGCYSIFGIDEDPRWMQVVATTVKVPALFFLTLLVTFPSLYVFNALVGSRLKVRAVFRLLIAALGVNLAVLASLGPIVAFFSLNTTTYSFMVLLNVLVFTVSGGLGLLFLLRTLHRLNVAPRVPMPPATTMPTSESPSLSEEGPNPIEPNPIEPNPIEPEPIEPEPIDAVVVESNKLVDDFGALDPMEGYVLGRHVKTVFGCWVVVFGLVGAQMSWVLRPFIGNPDLEFAWFRPRGSNFFEAVFETIVNLFS